MSRNRSVKFKGELVRVNAVGYTVCHTNGKEGNTLDGYNTLQFQKQYHN